MTNKAGAIAKDAKSTLYPKAGKGKKWTEAELKVLSAEHDKRTLSDSGGLRGRVRALASGKVSITFTYRYRGLDGKLKDYGCGTYPKNKITEIRAARDAAKVILDSGIDPREKHQAERIEKQDAIAKTIADEKKKKAAALTVADLFNDWISSPNGVNRKDGNAALIRLFNKDILPSIGDVKVSDLTDKEILNMLQAIKDRAPIKNDPQRGLNRTIDTAFGDLAQLLRWGEKRKPWRRLMIEGNPVDLIEASQIEGIQDEGYKEVRERILNEDEIRELKFIFNKLETEYQSIPAGKKYGNPRPVSTRVQCAVWICLSTLCRIGELLQSRWEHIDLDSGTWFIPAANTKGRKNKRNDHPITLSSFAVAQFKRLKAETGDTDFCFPSKNNKSTHVCLKSVSKQVGDRQAMFKNRAKPLAGRHHNNDLVLSAGANGEWTPHDLRRTGATMMQKLGVPPEIIDRCQNHVVESTNKSAKHYQHYDYAKEKAEAWRTWGNHLDVILNNANIITFTRRA